jgi:hypothetical protein
VTFVVRISRDDAGRVTGVVERVRTGQKERVESFAAIATVIARMVEAGHVGREEESPGTG